MNFKQIWVFPMPPMPYKRNDFLWSSTWVVKWSFKLFRYSSLPMKKILECFRGVSDGRVLLAWGGAT